MEDITNYIMDLVRAHGDWAFLILGLIAFGESLFLVGLFIPATPIFIAVGGLIAAAELDPVPLLVFTIIGAVAGDIVSYVIGHKSGRRIIYSPVGKSHRKTVAKAKLFFRKYGMMSVFLGRFLGPLRCTVPFVAGMTKMDQLRFQTANCISALLWAPFALMPGWLAVTGFSFI